MRQGVSDGSTTTAGIQSGI